MIYFNAYTDLDLSSKNHFKLTLVSFWHVPIGLLVFPYILAQQNILGSFCIFSNPFLDLLFLQGVLISFSVEVYLKTKIWLHTHIHTYYSLHVSVFLYICMYMTNLYWYL